ncbi:MULTISPECIES: hypothetical protein [Lysobacter]|uniref:hypothetical protein n=1 Tax=Lysobacter TaxID=68 RepID=UPI001F3E9771|nr:MULTISPECIES: hypothetical protein [Lysobacter]UJB20856.1 hypothetical protein L1A79_07270 [Lysobacter capsici]UJQ30030.1 hypothetical protein L2D09_07590 [Lysobacter gummosus]
MPITPIRSAFIQRFRSDNRLAIIGPLSSGKRIHIGDVFEFGSVAHRAAEDAGFAPSRHHRSHCQGTLRPNRSQCDRLHTNFA